MIKQNIEEECVPDTLCDSCNDEEDIIRVWEIIDFYKGEKNINYTDAQDLFILCMESGVKIPQFVNDIILKRFKSDRQGRSTLLGRRQKAGSKRFKDIIFLSRTESLYKESKEHGHKTKVNEKLADEQGRCEGAIRQRIYRLKKKTLKTK